MRKRRLWLRALAGVAVIAAIGGWLKLQPADAQLNNLQALPGSGQQVTIAPPIVVNASALPVVSASTPTGPVRAHDERYLIPEEQFEQQKRRARLPGFGPTLAVTTTAATPARSGPLT